MEAISIQCPSCGASISTHTRKCEYCNGDIIIKSLHTLAKMSLPQVNKYISTYRTTIVEHPNNIDINTSIGMCFLKLKKYDQAIEIFEKAQNNNVEDATPFFYSAIARLKGRKPFLCSRQEIDAMETDIQAAISINPCGQYYYFLAYIGWDYFKRKYLKHQPEWRDSFEAAINYGLSSDEIEEFHAMTGTPIERALNI